MFAGKRPQPLTLQQRVNTMGKNLWPEPTSPAATTITTFSSLSWAAEKSAAELRVHLKNAHMSLREKEKDLTLAAEIGHYLLENNAALKSQYESLLRQQEEDDWLCSSGDDCQGDDNYDDDHDRDLILLSRNKMHQQVLGELQDKNMELQRLLEDAQHQTDKVKMVHDKKARELEYDITLLKDHLDMAAQRIEEMEDHDQQHPSPLNKDQQQQHHQDEASRQQRQQQHDALLLELQLKIDQLEHENNQLIHNRQTIQDRLDRALYDVDALQTQFNIGEWTREGYAQLNDAYQQQFSHIAQLNVSLEEHRHILTNLVEHGGLGHMYSHLNDLPAISHSTSSAATTLQSTTDHHPHTVTKSHSLMAELEKAWHRDQSASGTTTQQQAWRFYDDGEDDDDDNHDLHQDDDIDDGYSSLSGGHIVAKDQQHDSSRFTDMSCFHAPLSSSFRSSPGKLHLIEYPDHNNSNMDYAMIEYNSNNSNNSNNNNKNDDDDDLHL
ncbi:hypothetical protein [Absidia glauca]|uniref:HAP1 N-terminal domain-containing protein n=1 Tax=Absidia glauca TaxID=4829 RepID=A0A168NVL1_ABSGL|nr:hypothetical protein [Absidia glauca]